jgi:hypothetical protein
MQPESLPPQIQNPIPAEVAPELLSFGNPDDISSISGSSMWPEHQTKNLTTKRVQAKMKIPNAKKNCRENELQISNIAVIRKSKLAIIEEVKSLDEKSQKSNQKSICSQKSQENRDFIILSIIEIENFIKLLEGSHKGRSKRLIQTSN